jgi:GxxExxY protein
MQQVTKQYIDELSYKIIGCAIEVHKQIGPGLIESVYEKCFVKELSLRSINFKTQLWVPIQYKGINLNAALRADVLVEDLILVELKAMDGILPVHKAQVLTYMKLMQKPKGILINFNCTNIFKEGQKTFVNDLYITLPMASL